MLRLHEGGVVLFGVTPRGHGMRNEAREGASMNSKRRMRAVILSTLLVFACLTAIPAPSGALPIKWLLYPPMIGDPDQPSTGPFYFGFLGWRFSLHRLTSGAWMIVPASGSGGR